MSIARPDDAEAEAEARGGGRETRRLEVHWLRAMGRGLLCRCPACGRGRVFAGYLKVAAACDACGQELHHHRADDLPPYLVIFVVGHAIVWGVLVAEMSYEVPLWVQLAVWPALTLVLCLALLPPLKGAVVGLQYALGMHGFGARRESRAAGE